MKDADRDVRWRAADALGEIGDPRAVDPLILTLNDSDWTVRRAAESALVDIGEPALSFNPGTERLGELC